MPFFLITFIISILAIGLTWIPALTTNPVGITNIFQCIYQTAAKRLVSQGLSLFAFAFFLHAILQSQVFQSLFATKRKWLAKRKFFTIGLITIITALLSSNLSWFDEFVHFYPLVIPLLLAMGFDFFSALLCLYGGSIAGLMGVVSTERMNNHFQSSLGSATESINYTGWSGIGFRLVSFVLFVSLIILFNIWYCSRNRNKSTNKKTNLIKKETPPPFNQTRKIILGVTGFFLLGSILAQITPIAKGLSLDKVAEKTPAWISSDYKKEEDKYEEKGKIGEMKIAKVKDEKENYWGTFGEWGSRAIDCWLITGGIIICWLAKQGVMNNLISAIQKTVPLILVYIFAAVPATILQNSGVSNNLAKILLPTSVITKAKYWALLPIFALALLFTFFISSTAIITALIAALAPTLVSISDSTLIYAALFAWLGGVLGMAFSPNNGILVASLEKSKITYKQFIKKTWKLGLIMLVVAFSLVWFWTYKYVK